MDVSGKTAALNDGSLEEMEERDMCAQLLDIFLTENTPKAFLRDWM